MRAALLALAFVLSLFLGRLVQLQGLDAPAYAAAAAENRLRTVTLPATRGSILDRNGIALATSVEARNVTADQKLIAESTKTDAHAIAVKLSPLVGIGADTLTKRLTGTRRFVYVAKDVTPETWREISKLELVGIFSEKVGKRVYPGGSLAGNVVGFVGADGHGLGGVEYALQDTLAGRDGQATYERSEDGLQIPVATSMNRAPVPGTDVVLTIDRDIQWIAENAVAAKVKEVKAASGSVVVLDPRTGRVLALAAAPVVDPNRPGRSKPADRGNRPLEEAFEPGSTGKLLTASALIEEGAVTPSTPITVPKRLARAGKTFKDWEEHGELHLTYAGTVARSSNMGTILATERMGFDKLYSHFREFGVGERLDLGLPENGGSLPRPEDWSVTTPYTLAFGQSYSVNALQMASMVGAIANDGVRVHPRVVEAYLHEDATREPPRPPRRVRVISVDTARTVRLLMEGVVGEGGTAPNTAIPGYRIGGKTGTAQRYEPSCGCYRGYTMSYIGIAPADDPALVVAVTLQNPQSGSGGGSTAGPVFKEVMSFALQSERIPPTGAAPPKVRLTTD